MLHAALDLASRTNEDDDSAEGEWERRAYPLKVYADVVEGALDVSGERRDYLSGRMGAILDAGSANRPAEYTDLGNRLNVGAMMRDLRRTVSFVRSDYIGWEVDRFFRASKSAMACVATIGQRLFDKMEGSGWEDAKPVASTELRRLVVECPLDPGGISTRYDHEFLTVKEDLKQDDLKGLGEAYAVYHVMDEMALIGLHRDPTVEEAIGETLGKTRCKFPSGMADALVALREAR